MSELLSIVERKYSPPHWCFMREFRNDTGGEQFWLINDMQEMFAVVSISVKYPNAEQVGSQAVIRAAGRDYVRRVS